jgi:hypothetical protein
MIDPMPTVAPPFLILVTPYLQNVDTVVIILDKISHIIGVNILYCFWVTKLSRKPSLIPVIAVPK